MWDCGKHNFSTKLSSLYSNLKQIETVIVKIKQNVTADWMLRFYLKCIYFCNYGCVKQCVKVFFFFHIEVVFSGYIVLKYKCLESKYKSKIAIF